MTNCGPLNRVIGGGVANSYPTWSGNGGNSERITLYHTAATGGGVMCCVDPSPPALPPLPAPVASISGDPHVRGAHGDSFDFRGKHGGTYVLLSTTNLSLAAGFEHAVFFTPHSKMWVRGSWIRHAYWTIRTSRGRLVHVRLDAEAPSFNGSRAMRTTFVDDVRFSFRPNVLTVRTPRWNTHAQVMRGAPHYGQLRVDITIQPLYNVVAVPGLAPHGLLGQSYDGDGAPLHG
eukprot:69060-Prymnesium_polylepis.1